MSVIKVKNNQGEFEEISTLTGPQGSQGNPGIGIAGGGQVNTFLAKNSSTDYDTTWKNIFDLIYPIGSIYMSVNATSPDTLFGGSWQKIEGKFLLGTSNSYSLNSEGGEANHTLTINEMPSHQHSVPFGATTAGDSSGFPYAWESGLTSATQGKGWGANAGTFAQGKTQPHNNMPPYLAVNIWKRTA